MRAWWEVDPERLHAFQRCAGGPPGDRMPAGFAPAAWQAFPEWGSPVGAWLAALDVRLALPVAAGERLFCRLDRLASRPRPGGELQAYRLDGARDTGEEAFSCRIELWTGDGGGAGPERGSPSPAGPPVWTGTADPATIAAYAAATGDSGPLHDRFAHGTWIGAALEQGLLRRAGREGGLRRLRLRLLAPLPIGATLRWWAGRAGEGGGGTEVTAVASDGAGRRVARARCRIA